MRELIASHYWPQCTAFMSESVNTGSKIAFFLAENRGSLPMIRDKNFGGREESIAHNAELLGL